MNFWSAFTATAMRLALGGRNAVTRLLFGRDTLDGGIYVEEVSETEIALHVELGPKRAWRKLTRRWRTSLRRDPTSARILNNLGVAYEQRGLFELAGDSYRKALDLAPDNVHFRRNYELFRRATERRPK